MAHIQLVTGGQRSGKSAMAENLLLGRERVLYIATARCFDSEMEARIRQHRERRPAQWETAEADRHIDRLLAARPAGDILLDDVGHLITNIMLDQEPDFDSLSAERIALVEDTALAEITRLTDVLAGQDRTAVLVTGEVGMSLVSPYRMGRVFADILGRANQLLAARSDEVHLLVCGIPLRIK